MARTWRPWGNRNPLQRLVLANTGGQGLHVAKAFVHGFEAIAYKFKAFAETGFLCLLQFFINGNAHLFQLLLIALLHGGDLLFEGGAHAVEQGGCVGVLFALLVEQGEEIVFLYAVELVDALRQVFLKTVECFFYFFAGFFCVS
jgi:hypothetical protein